MAFSFSNSTMYFTSNTAPISAAPLTLYARSNPSTNINPTPICLGGSSSNDLFFLLFDTTNKLQAATQAAGTYKSSSIGNYSINTWYSASGVFETAARTVYLDASAGTTETTSLTPSIGQFGIACTYRNNNATLQFNGLLAEVAVWSAVLTSDEIVSLNKGFRPSRVRPQSLVYYNRFLRDQFDYKGGLSMTKTGSPSVADHPRVY